jgi:hypothetical protein
VKRIPTRPSLLGNELVSPTDGRRDRVLGLIAAWRARAPCPDLAAVARAPKAATIAAQDFERLLRWAP